jgi:hypothetical protein
MVDENLGADVQRLLSVFVAYAREDEFHLEALHTHLAMLRRQGQVDVWYDRRIEPGKDWEREIDREIETAALILLLVSPNFLDSDYCFGTEMQIALRRHNAGGARVIPIVVRPCEWQKTELAKIQALPKDGLPISRWSDNDVAWLDVTAGIRRAVDSLLQEPANQAGTGRGSRSAPQPSAENEQPGDRQSRPEDQAILRILPGENHAGPWIFRVLDDRRAQVMYRVQNVGRAPARDIRAQVRIGNDEPVEIKGPEILGSLRIADREGFLLPLVRPYPGGAGSPVPADYPDSDPISITFIFSDFEHDRGEKRTEPFCFRFARSADRAQWRSQSIEPCPRPPENRLPEED